MFNGMERIVDPKFLASVNEDVINRYVAELRHTVAMGNLGYNYENGLGVDKDFQRAFKWYLMAAESGDSMYQLKVAGLYEDGISVKKSIPEAIKWYRKAADQGDQLAIDRLKELE